MNTYQHTQRGTLIIVWMLVMSIGFAILGFTVAPQLFIAVPILLVSGWLFRSLTIEIDECELRWRFGPGIIRKRVSLSDVNSARSVRTHFIEGWGIHLSRFGWLYNVSGRDAVEVTLKTGKRFALGTDEPEILLAAIHCKR